MAAYYFISVFQPGSGNYSYQQLMRDVKAKHVTAITIKQNKEVPTGTVTVELGSETIKAVRLQMSMKRSKTSRRQINLLVIGSRLKELITAEI